MFHGSWIPSTASQPSHIPGLQCPEEQHAIVVVLGCRTIDGTKHTCWVRQKPCEEQTLHFPNLSSDNFSHWLVCLRFLRMPVPAQTPALVVDHLALEDELVENESTHLVRHDQRMQPRSREHSIVQPARGPLEMACWSMPRMLPRCLGWHAAQRSPPECSLTHTPFIFSQGLQPQSPFPQRLGNILKVRGTTSQFFNAGTPTNPRISNPPNLSAKNLPRRITPTWNSWGKIPGGHYFFNRKKRPS